MFFGPGAKFGRRLVEAPAANPGHEIWPPFVAKQCIRCCSAGLGRDLGGVPFEVFVQIAGQIVKPSEPLRERVGGHSVLAKPILSTSSHQLQRLLQAICILV